MPLLIVTVNQNSAQKVILVIIRFSWGCKSTFAPENASYKPVVCRLTIGGIRISVQIWVLVIKKGEKEEGRNGKKTKQCVEFITRQFFHRSSPCHHRFIGVHDSSVEWKLPRLPETIGFCNEHSIASPTDFDFLIVGTGWNTFAAIWLVSVALLLVHFRLSHMWTQLKSITSRA